MRRLLCLLLLVGCVAQPRFTSERLAPITQDLLSFAQRQCLEMQIPGIWMAVLDIDSITREEHLWACAVDGVVHSARGALPDSMLSLGSNVLATHRIASVSKLYTATAAMVLVQRRVLDLDVPVSVYLPEFAPRNPFGRPVTLRHLLAHESGIVREAPVGHYFDGSEPTLSATVASLNDTALVFEPGTQWKYSNSALGVVGEVIARVTGKSFEQAVRELVLDPLELHDSDFAPRDDLVERQADGVMWTYDGRDVPTPGFRFGYTPAAGMRSTVVDMVRFARSRFPFVDERVLGNAKQAEMWQLDDDEESGVGIGFFVRKLDGHLRVDHGGSVYGFASSLMALPELGLAVAVVCTRDFANDVCDTIAVRALRAALANREGRTLPAAEFPRPVGVERARELAGAWRAGEYWVQFYERDGELYYDPDVGVRTRLRLASDGALVADDPLAIGGRRLTFLANGNPHDGKVEYVRDDRLPDAAPAELGEYLGEYGWPFNSLVVYEDHGKLAVLIEWVVRDLPVRESKDVWRFLPGLYTGDQVRFTRDEQGAIDAVLIGGARFPRRAEATAGTYRMPLVRPIPELVREARAAAPPQRPAGKRAFDLVDLSTLTQPQDAPMQFDIRYATENNFVGAKVYDRPVAKLQRDAAMALLQVHRDLRAHGYGLLVFDAYRPWWVTKVFWDAAPLELKHFVANPANGSRHNRGCAVDLTLFELATGAPVTMPSGFDEFTERAYADYPGGTSRQRHCRELLRRTMEQRGFAVYEHEWWHFDFHSYREFGIGNEAL